MFETRKIKSIATFTTGLENRSIAEREVKGQVIVGLAGLG